MRLPGRSSPGRWCATLSRDSSSPGQVVNSTCGSGVWMDSCLRGALACPVRRSPNSTLRNGLALDRTLPNRGVEHRQARSGQVAPTTGYRTRASEALRPLAGSVIREPVRHDIGEGYAEKGHSLQARGSGRERGPFDRVRSSVFDRLAASTSRNGFMRNR